MKKVPWDTRLRQVTEFVATYGRLPEPRGNQNEKLLSNWIGVQRQKYHTGCLTEDRIRLYADLGIIQRKPPVNADTNWLNCYQQYLNFIAEYGEKPKVNKANAEEYKLHSWAGYQRKSCACRTKEQQKMLISAGIITESLLEKRLKTAPITDSADTSVHCNVCSQFDRLFRLEDFITCLARKIRAMESEVRCNLCAEIQHCERTSLSPCFHGNEEWLRQQAQDWWHDFNAANEAYFAYLEQLQREDGHDPYTAEAALRTEFPYLGQHGEYAKYVMAVWMQRDNG